MNVLQIISLPTKKGGEEEEEGVTEAGKKVRRVSSSTLHQKKKNSQPLHKKIRENKQKLDVALCACNSMGARRAGQGLEWRQDITGTC